MKNPDRTIIDNRTKWYLKNKGLVGVTMGWDGLPVICDNEGKILTREADEIINSEFYQAPDDWPTCPLTGNKIPIADNL